MTRKAPRRQGPSLRQHRNGQWTVRIGKRDHYLGSVKKVSEEEAQRRRFALLAQNANGELPSGRTRTPVVAEGGITIGGLVGAYLEAFCSRRPDYRDRSGKPTGHARNVSDGLQVLLERHADMPAAGFSRSLLIDFRDGLQAGRSRSTINRRLSRVKELFRWGVERELVPEAVWSALLPVKSVGAGEGKPPRKVGAVSEEAVLKTLPHLAPHYQAIVRLLLATGARASEILTMRRSDLEIDGGVWVLHVKKHKTQWRGQDRTVILTPEAQEILRPWLPLDSHSYVWCPARSFAQEKAAKRAARKTPLTPSQRARDDHAPRRKFRPHFSADTVGTAVARACRKAGVPHWHIHQLRHTAGSRFERLYGMEVARILLGHTSANMTANYVHPDLGTAIQAILSGEASKPKGENRFKDDDSDEEPRFIRCGL